MQSLTLSLTKVSAATATAVATAAAKYADTYVTRKGIGTKERGDIVELAAALHEVLATGKAVDITALALSIMGEGRSTAQAVLQSRLASGFFSVHFAKNIAVARATTAKGICRVIAADEYKVGKGRVTLTPKGTGRGIIILAPANGRD